MAKVTVNFDTETKMAEVKIDGKLLENCYYVSLSRKESYEDMDMDEHKYYMNIEEHEKMEDGMTVRTLVSADEKPYCVECQLSKYDGFVEYNKEMSNASQALQKWLEW